MKHEAHENIASFSHTLGSFEVLELGTIAYHMSRVESLLFRFSVRLLFIFITYMIEHMVVRAIQYDRAT